ncbi:MAG: prepilin peptidase [Candidatus Magasanikbacteria bacterium]
MLYFFILFFSFLGAMLGSFLFAWVSRMQKDMSIVSGRSKCFSCSAEIFWYDNIPILSALILNFTCRKCKKRFSSAHFFAELFLALASGAFAWKYMGDWKSIEFFRDLLLICFLHFIFFYDLLYMEILDKTTTIPAVILFFFSLAFGWNTWHSMGIGVLIGAGFFYLQYIVSSGRWIGGGDIRLGLFMGVILGWQNTVFALFFAYILGALVSIVLLLMKKKTLASETPFGTYLTCATVFAMLYGNNIIHWYLGFLK